MEFFKYQGAGNDFILLDDREGDVLPGMDQGTIAELCDRHFGIGADGLMLLRRHAEYDFEMLYYNSDGAPSSMCGNGGRCIVRFAHYLGIRREVYHFLAVDGPHRAVLLPSGNVSLEMNDVTSVHQATPDAFVLDTGSPHYVTLAHDPLQVNVNVEGRRIRQAAPFGINVNFIRINGPEITIATYERGVEGETLACGTGVTAAAIVATLQTASATEGPFQWVVRAKGGVLSVRGRYANGIFTDLWLEGPAVKVFSGVI
ncbi:diaminopimelate epimerase [Lewinella lacunae]|uniref:Diaminopimelate epimerase n=1 Tax=Neolewinella lacunae TaxID=1517758 RepID=A0A923PIS1_9BACT|nr:diaminopimelate epimerase [Neolewinella lacunae]